MQTTNATNGDPMTTIRTMYEAGDDLANALLDLVEAAKVAQDTWDVLGDPSKYSFLTEENVGEMWELDLHAAVMAEQMVANTLDKVQRHMGIVNEQWVSFLASI